jgi:phage FluMu gp28-like protein
LKKSSQPITEQPVDVSKLLKPSAYFLPYQLDWLNDNSRVKIWEKSRRIGATYVQSYEDVRDIVFKKCYIPNRPVRKVYFTSADESAAREYIDYCSQWAKLYDITAKEMGYVVLDAEKDIKALMIEFSNGGKIFAMTSNPKRFRSKGGKVVWDEAAWHEDQRAMWKALRPSAMWGYPVRILSTHHGKQALFYQFTDDVKSNKLDWSLHTVTIYDAVRQGLVDKILGHKTCEDERQDWLENERKDCRDDEIWEEEYCCNAQDSATAWVEHELITACEQDNLLMTLEELMNLSEGEIYAGWDVARTNHLSVFWLVQKLGDVLYTRHIRAFKKTRFAIQNDFLEKIMKLPRLRRLCIDKTGIGMALEEAAREKHLSRVEGVNFSNTIKEALAIDGRTCLEDRKARLPKDELIRSSFHSIKKEVTSAGNVRFDADATDKSGHADHWWAFCLAKHAAKAPSAKPRAKSRPRKRDYGIAKGYS